MNKQEILGCIDEFDALPESEKIYGDIEIRNRLHTWITSQPNHSNPIRLSSFLLAHQGQDSFNEYIASPETSFMVNFLMHWQEQDVVRITVVSPSSHFHTGQQSGPGNPGQSLPQPPSQ